MGLCLGVMNSPKVTVNLCVQVPKRMTNRKDGALLVLILPSQGTLCDDQMIISSKSCKNENTKIKKQRKRANSKVCSTKVVTQVIRRSLNKLEVRVPSAPLRA